MWLRGAPAEARGAAAAAEAGRDEPVSEALAHEAVGDWVAAAGDKRQQMDEVHGGGRDHTHRPRVVEDDPRLQNVKRSPTDEELRDDDEQHLHRPSLGDRCLVAAVVIVALVTFDRRRRLSAGSVGVTAADR